jgi:ABC-2 type transport system ATP-binding protein
VTCAAAGYPASRADEVLELVGLTPAAKRKFKGYSLGMKQRLGIAYALLGDPQVLILDEPANGLDPEGIRWMRQLLQYLAGQGRTVLVSSHLLSEMEVLAQDLVIIGAGQLIRQGTVEQILGSMGDMGTVRVRTPKPEALAPVIIERGGQIVGGENGLLSVRGLDAAAVGAAAFAAGVELHELVNDRPDLENVFLQLTQDKAGIR